MDLALNNLQMLICHKTQTTNQPSFVFDYHSHLQREFSWLTIIGHTAGWEADTLLSLSLSLSIYIYDEYFLIKINPLLHYSWINSPWQKWKLFMNLLSIYIYIYIFIYIYIDKQTFCCTTSLQCGLAREMLQPGIETRIILRQSDIIPLSHRHSQRKWRNFCV